MTNGYVRSQLARALITANHHEDAATRARADIRVRSWVNVLEGIDRGTTSVGSRAPVSGLPAWVTLDVVRGGFATGRASADGPLDDDESERLGRMGKPRSREALFASYLTDRGMEELVELLDSRLYEVTLPEDGALLTVAALVRAGHRAVALDLLETLRPYSGVLRLMPRTGRPSTRPADHVHRRTIAEVRGSLQGVALSRRVEAQREALSIWLPLTDRFVAWWGARSIEARPLYADEVRGAEDLLTAYDTAVRDNPRCRKYRDRKENLPILVAATRAALRGEPAEAWAGRVRHVLSCVEAKRGAVSGPVTADLRREQARTAGLPSHHQLATIATARLDELRQDDGISDPDAVLAPVTTDEGRRFGVPPDHPLPETVVRKVLLGRSAPLTVLVRDGIIPSAEVLAELVPALTARHVATSVTDAALGDVLGATYAAFRRRRTLLLLDLAKQVQFTELPWVGAALAASGVTRRPDDPGSVARQVAALAIDSFPGTILPNPLISELTTLYAAAGIDVPLTEELAADIFTGRFSAKFTTAAKAAAHLLAGSLYAAYYALDVAEILALDPEERQPRRRPGWLFGGQSPRPPETFADVCSRGVPDGKRWWVARNGMIIERQQVLTTHNLAALVHLGGVQPSRPWEDLALDAVALTARLLDAAQRQPRPLRTVKDAAYAWRQAVFFVSMEPGSILEVIQRMRSVPLASSPPMSDIIEGLQAAASDEGSTRRPFLGWTTGSHWVLGPHGVRPV